VWVGLLVAAVIASAALLAYSQQGFTRSPTQNSQLATQVIDAPATFRMYCAGCHTSGRARVDFDGRLDRQEFRQDQATWKHALVRLENGSMPPRRFPQPSSDERQALIRWLRGELASLETDDESRYQVRRLRKNEYQNTIHDLLGVRWQPHADFPADDNGWDVANEIPALSVEHFEKYDRAAQEILARVELAQLLPRYVPGYLEALTAFLAVPGLSGAAEFETDVTRAFLASFARRAFRRSVTAEEVSQLMVSARNEGGAPLDRIRWALNELLTSRDFLYRVETRGDPSLPPLESVSNDFELASRLAFFLWNSTPDEELLNLAESDTLKQKLDEQTRRMLGDDRAKSLAAGFGMAWLGLEDYGSAAHVEASLFRLMRMETESFISWIMQNDRNVLELLDADYSFLNGSLAKHYGIEGVEGEEFRRVNVIGTKRGGLVTQASILALTSRGALVSPVQRGKWILDKLLGTPPPAPPAGLLEAFERQRSTVIQAGTPRERMAQHNNDPSCSNCHSKIDALGYALENFDASGVWRPVNTSPASGTNALPDGTALDSPEQLRQYLLSKQQLFIRTLCSKLLSHALGRRLQDHDQPQLDQITAEVVRNPRFFNVIGQIVRSKAFAAAS